MDVACQLIEEMCFLYDEVQSKHLSRFFKTGKGEYGEGDKFLGIKVPITRSLVKKYKKEVTLNDIDPLINSEWHEIRLAGFLLLVELYKEGIKKDEIDSAEDIIKFYLRNLNKSNNWDLVDLISPYLLGDWILRNPLEEKILLDLSENQNSLWHQRVSIVSTLTLIRKSYFDITFKIAERYLSHPHDLIHKATGWMLREIGKKGGKDKLVEFLLTNKNIMPRTMLRYAIERFPENERKLMMRK